MLIGQLRRSMTDENGPDVHRSLHGGLYFEKSTIRWLVIMATLTKMAESAVYHAWMGQCFGATFGHAVTCPICHSVTHSVAPS